MLRALLSTWLLMSVVVIANADENKNSKELKDPYFGEALYFAYQKEYFTAIARLDTELRQYYGVDEPQLDSLHFHINQAEFSVGDIELSYRMHHRAGRAIKAVIEGNVAPAVRNEAIYRLARIYFQKEQFENALHTIERIEGDVHKKIENDVEFLKAHIYMANGRFGDAEEIFSSLEGDRNYQGFASYNRAVAQLAQDKEEEGVSNLEKAGLITGSEREDLAIRDKSNVVLASRMLDKGNLSAAQRFFDRVRIDGPFSNRALLGFGWAAAKQEKFGRALVPWSILAKRNVTDASVQEAILAVPYAYGKLGLYGKAATMYNSALEAIGGELDRLDSSIDSIKRGKFLKALVREEVKSDEGWVIKLRELEETPETYYLMQLMASHDFQSSLKNYLDLEQLRKYLEFWAGYYDSYEEIIKIRSDYYEPLLPTIDENFRKLDSRIRLRTEQRDRIHSRLTNMLVSPRPDYLTTAEERIAKESLEKLEKRLGDESKNLDNPLVQRINRLKGYLHWNINTEYDERLTVAFQHLEELDRDIAQMKENYNSFVRTRQAATQSYQGYDDQIRRLRIKTQKSQQKVKALMARQGHMLEVMAVNELQKRREKLEQYQVKARFAMAESYDRATMKQAAPSLKNKKGKGTGEEPGDGDQSDGGKNETETGNGDAREPDQEVEATDGAEQGASQ